MKEINLTRGKVAIVSDEDYVWISQYKWHSRVKRNKRVPDKWYACRHSSQLELPIFMHKEIMMRLGWPRSQRFDHTDANGLNNQRDNLRPCSNSENIAAAVKKSGYSSKFKGVHFVKRLRKWLAAIRKDGKYFYLGIFEDENLAAMAYNAAAAELFKEFAYTNEVDI